MVHFGVTVRDKKPKLDKKDYAIINNKSSLGNGNIYSDEWCEEHREDCLKNFDLNMEYFQLLDKDEFNKEIDNFLNEHKEFKEVKDLKLYNGKSGYYIMILDEYKQLYVGTTNDIKKRIQTHWSKKMPFDRLIWGSVDNSILSINSFKALDTTRIYAFETEDTFSIENYYIECFNTKFVCNRIEGGFLKSGLLETINSMKTRKLK